MIPLSSQFLEYELKIQSKLWFASFSPAILESRLELNQLLFLLESMTTLANAYMYSIQTGQTKKTPPKKKHLKKPPKKAT